MLSTRKTWPNAPTPRSFFTLKSLVESVGVVELVAAIVGLVSGEGDSDTAVAPVSNKGDLVTTVGDE